MSGWFKAPTADWPVIAEMIPRPWPLEAARMDLAYLADRSRLAGEEIPGGRELGTRWGWGHKKVRLLLDKIKTVNSGAQLGHKRGTKEAHHEEVETEQSETKGHKRGTKRAQKGHTSNILYTETDTETEEKEKINKKENILPDCDQPTVAQTARGQAPLSDKPDSSLETEEAREQREEGESEKIGLPPHSVEAGQAEPEAELTPLASGPRSNSGFDVPPEALAAQEVWSEHRKHHPKVGERPTKPIYDIVKSAYKLLSGEHEERVADMVLLVEAANCCPDKPFSYDIRAIGWDGGTDRSGDLDTIFRHKRIPGRLQAAKDWAEKGKPKQDIQDFFFKNPQRQANAPPEDNFLKSLFGSKKQENQTVLDAEFKTFQQTFFQIAED